MNEQEISVFERLEKTLIDANSRRGSVMMDIVMKIATGVSTAGILALFALFTVQIPALNASIDRLTWQQEQMREQLEDFKQFTQKPRFTKEDFVSEMRLYDNRIRLMENELIKRSDFIKRTNERLTELEKR